MPRFNPTTLHVSANILRNRYPEALESIFRTTLMEVSERIVRDTPVDTGFLRGSWSASFGGTPQQRDGSVDPGGGKATADVAVKLADFRIDGRTFWFTNSAAYARRLEYGFTGQDSLGRNFDQRGRYFVRDNVSRFREILLGKARQFQRATQR